MTQVWPSRRRHETASAQTIGAHRIQTSPGRLKAGTTARPALWLSPTADGVTDRLRCTVTIGENTWGPVVSEVKILAKPRIVTATDRRIER